MPNCDYCDKPVDPPLPVHPVCARIWLKGWTAREQVERQKFVKRVIKRKEQKHGYIH